MSFGLELLILIFSINKIKSSLKTAIGLEKGAIFITNILIYCPKIAFV